MYQSQYPLPGYPQQGYNYPPPQGQQYQQGYGAYPPSQYPPGQQQYQQGMPYPGAPPPPQPTYIPPPKLAPQAQPQYGAMDVEAGQAAAAAGSFSEQRIRQAFIRKVFFLVFLQLCVTVGVASIFMFVTPVKDYVSSPGGQWVFIVSWVITLAALVTLMCNSTLRRKHPQNIIALFAFTLVMSVQVGCVCAYWDVAVVLQAFSVTTATVLGLTLAALFLPFDLTKFGNVLAIAGMAFFFGSLMIFFVGFWYVSTWWYLAISAVGAVLFSLYLVYDIQKLMGGKQVKISPDEYVFASVQIYLDIVVIFLYILQIVGAAQR